MSFARSTTSTGKNMKIFKAGEKDAKLWSSGDTQ
jgi:hypothetical protein